MEGESFLYCLRMPVNEITLVVLLITELIRCKLLGLIYYLLDLSVGVYTRPMELFLKVGDGGIEF